MSAAPSTAQVCLLEPAIDQQVIDPMGIDSLQRLTHLCECAIKKMEADNLVLMPVSHAVVVGVGDGDASCLDVVIAIYRELNQYNKSRTQRESISVRIALSHSDPIGGPLRHTDAPTELLFADAIAKAVRLIRLASAGHILMTADFQRLFIATSVQNSNAQYFGTYRIAQGANEQVFGYVDSINGIGAALCPSVDRLEDEHSQLVYAPPTLKLLKPRYHSEKNAKLVATSEPKILVLCPHPNDAPWGCAGTLMRLRKEFNARIFFHFFTSTRLADIVGTQQYGPADRALPPALWSYAILTGSDPKLLIDETSGQSEADAVHLIQEKTPTTGTLPHPIYIERHPFDTSDKPPLKEKNTWFEDGFLDKDMDQLRGRCKWLQDRIAPDIILCPSLCDRHADHRAVAEAAISVNKFQQSIWHYELPQAIHATGGFKPTLFLDVTDFAETKLRLLETCFRHDVKRFHFSTEAVQAVMRMHAIEGFYERRDSNDDTGKAPSVEAFEARLYV